MNDMHLTIIKKLRVFFDDYTDYVKTGERPKKFRWRASVYDSGTQIAQFYGKSRKKAERKVRRWVYDNYHAPSNLEESNLLYHQPEELDE
jgi:hypothetical protein